MGRKSKRERRDSFQEKKGSKQGERVCITGTVDMTRMGYGFISSDDMEDDVFVSAKNLNTALHGDKVKVWLYAKEKGVKARGRSC